MAPLHVDISIPLTTKSTGTMSKGPDPSPFTYFNKPSPVNKLNPPAADKESVHPLNGYRYAQAMILGL